MPNEAAFSTVAIIGLGLIGGSFARLIRHQLPQTTLLALDTPETLAMAKADGTINHALSGLDDPRLLECDLIVLGTHLQQSESMLQALAAFEKPLRVIDLGSTKAALCQLAETLPSTLTFIGGHPLAGREVSGYANSRWDLFLNKRFLLSPCSHTPADFQSQIIDWLTALGTLPVVLDAAEHDRLMAVVSHFPQLYAIALGNLLNQNTPETTLHFLGGGIDDQMRLMQSPYAMWHDVFHNNANNVDAVLTQFIGILQAMQADLRADNLSSWFETSRVTHEIYQSYKNALADQQPGQ